ncbi:hypothetical protein G4B88_008124 [Cannabis sativa]|uniref:Uncharacterized protein n=1 Tax=Cannabis sativa TaxID=3483 RepID=A0A7J6I8V1_CANSA|nr:hypothetical protein G4B88_008124 [Cannabis sativa]
MGRVLSIQSHTVQIHFLLVDKGKCYGNSEESFLQEDPSYVILLSEEDTKFFTR